MKNPVFIMGTQRSGTTLLTRILSAHPTIFIQNEMQLPSIFKGTTPTEIIDKLIEQYDDRTGRSFKELISQEDMLWGLKDPQLTEYIPQLRMFLPESKFIIIVRDGRGVTNSYMENKWGLGTNAYYGALRWKKEVNDQLGFMDEAPDNFLYIRYEDIIDNLEDALRNICTFLDKPFDEDMLSYESTQSHYSKKRENMHTFKKPDKRLAEKWKNKLSAFEINIIETVAGDLLEQLGYELAGNKIRLTPLQLFYFKWHQKIIGEFQIQYRWRKYSFIDQVKKIKKNLGIHNAEK